MIMGLSSPDVYKRQDKGWRKKAIRRLAPFSPKKMLDIATVTGDFAILAAQMLHPDQLIGADISEGMMEIGLSLIHISYDKYDKERAEEKKTIKKLIIDN